MPMFQAVLFDFFGTLTRSVQRGLAHQSTAELLGCPNDTLVEVLDRTYYQRASGLLGNAEATLRWVCDQAGVHPSDGAVRAAVTSATGPYAPTRGCGTRRCRCWPSCASGASAPG